MVNVICMKWGSAYSAHDVNTLYSMVRRNLTLPFRFVCFTDDRTGIADAVECLPMPDRGFTLPPPYTNRPWRKISLFAAELGDLTGETLFLDLDLVIIANIDCFFEYPGDFCIIRNWTQPDRRIGNSSVYRFRVGALPQIYDDLRADPMPIIRRHRNSQTYLSHAVPELTFWPESWCRSFKRHCVPPRPLNLILRPRLPAGAKIVVFHGPPKPAEAARGIWPQPFKYIRPAPWVLDHWR